MTSYVPHCISESYLENIPKIPPWFRWPLSFTWIMAIALWLISVLLPVSLYTAFSQHSGQSEPVKLCVSSDHFLTWNTEVAPHFPPSTNQGLSQPYKSCPPPSRSKQNPLNFVFSVPLTHSAPATHTRLPYHCLECFSLRHPHSFSPHFLQVFANMLSFQWDRLRRRHPILPLLPPCFVFLHGMDHQHCCSAHIYLLPSSPTAM